MTHPYVSFEPRAFWRTAVAGRSAREVENVWTPKFEIGPETRIVTFGSCFAQHIGAALRARGFTWLQTEPPPVGLSEDNAKANGYGLFSCRTGNVYTAAMLRQWTDWALGTARCPEEFWEENGRWFDPFRPTIEPGGFASREEAEALRTVSLAAFGRAIRSARLLIFTLGLTEGWRNIAGGYEYQICPGTRGGRFDKALHRFHNAEYEEILGDLSTALDAMGRVNPRLKFLLTVSPVGLAATASQRHVLVAATESKSILRAVAGALSRRRADVDYFPSYELVSSASLLGDAFSQDRRNVTPEGVEAVMNAFFASVGAAAPASIPELAMAASSSADSRCDEELLAAFAPGA